MSSVTTSVPGKQPDRKALAKAADAKSPSLLFFSHGDEQARRRQDSAYLWELFGSIKKVRVEAKSLVDDERRQMQYNNSRPGTSVGSVGGSRSGSSAHSRRPGTSAQSRPGSDGSFIASLASLNYESPGKPSQPRLGSPGVCRTTLSPLESCTAGVGTPLERSTAVSGTAKVACPEVEETEAQPTVEVAVVNAKRETKSMVDPIASGTKVGTATQDGSGGLMQGMVVFDIDFVGALFAAVDENGDGDVTRFELMRALNRDEHLRDMLTRTLGIPAQQGSMKAKEAFEMVFDCVDVDHTHTITLNEMRNFIGDMNHMCIMQSDANLPADVRALLKAADVNKDGNLSPIEIIVALHAQPSLASALASRKAKEKVAYSTAEVGAHAAGKKVLISPQETKDAADAIAIGTKIDSAPQEAETAAGAHAARATYVSAPPEAEVAAGANAARATYVSAPPEAEVAAGANAAGTKIDSAPPETKAAAGAIAAGTKIVSAPSEAESAASAIAAGTKIDSAPQEAENAAGASGAGVKVALEAVEPAESSQSLTYPSLQAVRALEEPSWQEHNGATALQNLHRKNVAKKVVGAKRDAKAAAVANVSGEVKVQKEACKPLGAAPSKEEHNGATALQNLHRKREAKKTVKAKREAKKAAVGCSIAASVCSSQAATVTPGVSGLWKSKEVERAATSAELMTEAALLRDDGAQAKLVCSVSTPEPQRRLFTPDRLHEAVLREEAEKAAARQATADALAEKIANIICRFDWDRSGNLNAIELANAAADFWGETPTTAQLTAMIRASRGLDAGSSVLMSSTDPLVLSTNQFAKAMTFHDSMGMFDLDVAATALGEKDPWFYVQEVPKKDLGWKPVLDVARSCIIVGKVTDKALFATLTSGDAVLFVAGVPLGKVTDLKHFTALMKKQPRPTQITFLRGSPTEP